MHCYFSITVEKTFWSLRPHPPFLRAEHNWKKSTALKNPLVSTLKWDTKYHISYKAHSKNGLSILWPIKYLTPISLLHTYKRYIFQRLEYCHHILAGYFQLILSTLHRERRTCCVALVSYHFSQFSITGIEFVSPLWLLLLKVFQWVAFVVSVYSRISYKNLFSSP